MADFVTAGTQTVEVNGSVLFAANRVYSCNCPNIRHEPLSGRVVLLPGLYRVGFNGNFSAAAAGDVIFEVQQDGEVFPVQESRTQLQPEQQSMVQQPWK